MAISESFVLIGLAWFGLWLVLHLLLALAGLIPGLIGLKKWKQLRQMEEGDASERQSLRNSALICSIMGVVCIGYGLYQVLSTLAAMAMLVCFGLLSGM